MIQTGRSALLGEKTKAGNPFLH